MPTVTGKLEFQDYDAALVARGFDAFQPQERAQMINLGYRYVARAFPWSWESTSQVFPFTPGQYLVNVGTGLPGGIGSIEGIDVISNPYRKSLVPERQERFEAKWRNLDMTIPQNQGITQKYYYYEGSIYLLPPPQQAVSVKVYFRQYLPDMINPSDTPVLPQVFDEVIMDAALVRCHRRAHELDLAADVQGRVDDAINAMLQDDVWEMEELQERTLPDNQWY